MPSELKSEQARINGRKSRGPKTAEGKRAAAAARFKHGLYSVPTGLLPFESPTSRDILEQSYLDYWQPTSEPEMFLVQEMAYADWMLRRLQLIRDSLFAAEYDKATRTPYSGNIDPLNATIATTFENMANKSRALAELTRQERNFRAAKRRAIDELVLIRAKAPTTGRTQPSVLLNEIAVKVSSIDEARQRLTGNRKSTEEPNPQPQTGQEKSTEEPKLTFVPQNKPDPNHPNLTERDPRRNEFR